MASGDVDATDRLLDWRYLQAFPRRSPVNDLARHSFLHYPVQHHALPGDFWLSGLWWYLARRFFTYAFISYFCYSQFVHPDLLGYLRV
jgi:hypothetical protein